jgi:hypothetical protein
MDRRKALAVSVAVAMVMMAAAALAANFGLLGLVGRVEPVGQLSPVTPVTSTAVPERRDTGADGAVGEGEPSGTPSVEPPAGDGREDAAKTDQRHPEPEPEHERDD